MCRTLESISVSVHQCVRVCVCARTTQDPSESVVIVRFGNVCLCAYVRTERACG